MELKDIIRSTASRMKKAGITVESNSAYSTVAMQKKGYVDPYDGTDTFCFLQGEEADRFQAEATELWENEELDLDMDTILLYLAEPYTVLIDE